MNWKIFVQCTAVVAVTLGLIPKAIYHWFTILGKDLNIFPFDIWNPAESKDKECTGGAEYYSWELL